MKLQHVTQTDRITFTELEKIEVLCDNGGEMSQTVMQAVRICAKNNGSSTIWWDTTHHCVTFYFEDPKMSTYFQILTSEA